MNEQASAVHGEAQNEKKCYWTRVSGAYRFVFRALLLLLPIFVIVFMALCAGGFTRNSVFGFGKDLRAISSFLSSDYATVSYTYEKGPRAVLSYHDGVAAVTSGGIEVYSPDGERLLNVETAFSAPRAVCSQKYLLAYDFGGKSFTVTSPYGVLFSGVTDFPIYGADVADTGHFALITGSDTHLSQLLLYDANFHLIQRFARGSATTAVTLSDNGKYVAIGALRTPDGTAGGLVELYRIGIPNPAFRAELDEAVLAVNFTDSRYLAVLCEHSLRVSDLDGDWESTVLLEGAAIRAFDVNENGCALALSADPLCRESRVVVCDEKGDVLYDGKQAGDVTAISLAEEHVFWLSGAQAVRFAWETQGLVAVECPDGASNVFAVNKDALRVVYAGEARYIEFD